MNILRANPPARIRAMSANLFSAPAPPPLPPSQPAKPSRPRFITALAWTLIVFSALLLPISLITVLMILTGSYGTENIKLMDFLNVVVRPPATLIAGIGLLCRWRWAHTYCVALLASFGLWHATVMARGPSPERTYTSPSGVRTTVLASTVNYPAHIAVLTITLLVLVKLHGRPIRDHFNNLPRTTARPSRLQSIPQTPTPPAARPFVTITETSSRVMIEIKHRPRRYALPLVITLLAAIAVGTGWFVQHSLSTGKTYFPSKRATSTRHVFRAQEPIHYWASVALYSIVSLGSFGLATLAAREALRIDISGRGTGRFPYA